MNAALKNLIKIHIHAIITLGLHGLVEAIMNTILNVEHAADIHGLCGHLNGLDELHTSFDSLVTDGSRFEDDREDLVDVHSLPTFGEGCQEHQEEWSWDADHWLDRGSSGWEVVARY